MDGINIRLSCVIMVAEETDELGWTPGVIAGLHPKSNISRQCLESSLTQS